MPKGRYTIGAKGTHGCPGFPVVGDTGKVHGCHKDKASARAQQAAIYASEAQKSYEGCCPEDNPFEKAQGPCWEGYEMIGYKTKNGKKVPNCVKVDSKKAADNEDQSGESHDKKKKKLVKSDYTIVDSHPRCDGVALVETDGTNVLCYGSREDAQNALDGMNNDNEDSSVRPNDMNKIWKGSGFDTRR